MRWDYRNSFPILFFPFIRISHFLFVYISVVAQTMKREKNEFFYAVMRADRAGTCAIQAPHLLLRFGARCVCKKNLSETADEQFINLSTRRLAHFQRAHERTEESPVI